MAKLTKEQWEVAKAWLHDIFVFGGLLRNPARAMSVQDYGYMYGGNAGSWVKNGYQGFAQIICDFIKFRPVDYKKFKEVDSAIMSLSTLYFLPSLSSTYWRDRTRRKPEMLARYIATFCALNKIYWDPTNTTTYEMDEIKQTLIGAALWDEQCFTTQESPVKQRQRTTTSTTTAASQAGSATTGAPQNSYKSSGGQSSNIINIVGQPGQKAYAQSSVVFCIEADKIGKNTPNAFIKPLDSKYNLNGVATVIMGSGNGYTDCKCWFDDKTAADNFLAACQNKFGGKFTNIHIARNRPDGNGYFIVKTEFGECAIKASKMNEDLAEEKVADKKVKYTKAYKMTLDDFDKYEESFFSEM